MICACACSAEGSPSPSSRPQRRRTSLPPYLPLLASAPRGSSALEERARVLHCGEGQGLAWARRFAQQQGEQRGAIVDGQEEAAPLPLATPRYPY